MSAAAALLDDWITVAVTQFHWSPRDIEGMKLNRLAFYMMTANETMARWQKAAQGKG